MYEISHSGPIKLKHVSGFVELPPLHDQSVSTLQSESHPSPEILLLSSHSMNPSLKPLPQISRQVFVNGSKIKPDSISAQSLQELSVESTKRE